MEEKGQVGGGKEWKMVREEEEREEEKLGNEA